MVTLRGDPVYAVTKTYGLKSYLLSATALEELAYAKNLSDLVDILRPSLYGPFLAQLLKPFTAAEIEKALWKSLVDHHYRLIQTSVKPKFLEQLFMRYVYFNVKTVLKSKALGKSPDEIIKNVDLYPEELLGIRDITLKALNAKDPSEFLTEYLETELAETIRTAVKVWTERKDFSASDAIIDKAYLEGLYKAFKKVGRSERKFLTPFMIYELDVKALATALRARFWKLTSSQVRNLLPAETVTLDPEFLTSLAEIEDVKKGLEKLPENELFAKVRSEQNLSAMLSMLEENAKKMKLRWAYESFYKTPFRQALVVSYLVLKENEVRNLATIAKYIEEGIKDISFIKSSLSL
ncbi:MAG: V-type ATPase subunit [Candidatus Caldarchaeum sp.]